MEAGLAIGGALLSPVFQMLLEKLRSSDVLNYTSEGKVRDELNKWSRTLRMIDVVLDDAEARQISEKSVHLWVSELRDLAYDVEDVLDEFATEVQRRGLKVDDRVASTSKIRKLIPSCCVGLKPSTVKFNNEMFIKIQSISKKLDEIKEQKDLLSLVGRGRDMTIKGGERVPATSLVNETTVYGREEDRNAILKMLKAETSDKNVSVIAIVGMGGLGKTTLAQLIYNDASNSDFVLKEWVSVGMQFDILTITKTLVKDKFSASDEKDLNSLQVKLKEKLSGKKFLIVLDDVWTENYVHWTQFNLPFESGAHGSKIIVTTRSQRVSSMIGTEPYLLKELSYDDCLSVFTQHALGETNFDKHLDLKEAGTEMAKRCRGLPLAAKALGGLLRGNPILWESVLKSEIWEMETNMLPALRLSYYHLPSHLKQCFAYCAIFPDEYEFDKEELVLLWMAEGFLQQPKQNQVDEESGYAYFEDLLSRSFFQQSTQNKSLYVMHDLIRDLAQSVSGEVSIDLDKLVQSKSFENVRYSLVTHGFCNVSKKFQGLCKTKKLRTLLTQSTDKYLSHCYIDRNVLPDLLPQLKCLRVVSLVGYKRPELPNSISTLKLLRYLNLSYSQVVQLPTSLCELLNLQTLKLRGCRSLMELPMDIGNLINLQHLDIRETHELSGIPLQICNLKNLRTLSKFIVGGDERLGLEELGKFSHLKGELHIIELQNVVKVQDAEIANLKEKQGLHRLHLEWSNDLSRVQNDEIALQVLTLLQPHTNLKSLSITSYDGKAFPSWVGDISFRNMVEVKLHHCLNITTLPSLGQLPCLEELSISGMPQVKEAGAEFYGSGNFPSLEKLCIEDMRGWEKWSCNNGENEGKFQRLRELKIIKCPRLVSELPSCLPSLHELRIEECQEVVVRRVCFLTSLVKLYIRRISGLVNLDEINIGALVALKELEIHGLSLEEVEEGTLPCNLQNLEIRNCGKLVKLPNGLHRLTSLKELKIGRCPKLVSVAAMGFPSSLTRLEIWNCDSLESLPEGIIMRSNEETCHLEDLTIGKCPSLRWLTIGECVDSLKSLTLDYCTSDLLTDRLSHLIILVLSDCSNLERFPEKGLPIPTLVYLDIWSCKNLSSLPNHMRDLKSLSTLFIRKCDGVVSFPDGGFPLNLNQLWIENGKNMAQPMSEWGLSALSSLRVLSIKGACPSTNMVVSFPDDQLLPSSLTYLEIDGFQNLKSISRGLHNLTNLEDLSFCNSPKLKSLPKEGFPASLGSLSFNSCPLLEEGCKKDKGEFWPLISHIPHLSIDYTII